MLCNIFIECQYGFTQGISTIDAVFRLLKNILDDMNERTITEAIYLDLARAFIVHLMIIL